MNVTFCNAAYYLHYIWKAVHLRCTIPTSKMKDERTPAPPVQTPIKDTKSPVTRKVCVCLFVCILVHRLCVCNFACVQVCTSQAWPTLNLLISPWAKFTSSVLCPHTAPVTHTTTDIKRSWSMDENQIFITFWNDFLGNVVIVLQDRLFIYKNSLFQKE